MRSHRDIHKSGSGGTNQVLQHVRGFLNEPNRVQTCSVVATTQQREKLDHQGHITAITDKKDRDLDYKYSVMPLLIYPEDSNEDEDDPRESLSDPSFTESTPETKPPREKPPEEPTSETNYDPFHNLLCP